MHRGFNNVHASSGRLVLYARQQRGDHALTVNDDDQQADERHRDESCVEKSAARPSDTASPPFDNFILDDTLAREGGPMTDESESVPAVKLRFNPSKAFPPDDPISFPLLRLMAATNDALLNQKHTIIARERAESAGALDKTLLNGELGYHVRMLCGHLFEAGRAFRSLDEALGDRISALLQGDPEGEAALARLREVYGDTSEGSFNAAVLGRIRNLASFHYKEEQFREGVAAFGDARAEVIISLHRGIGRYVITDQIMSRSVWEFVGGTEEKLWKMLENAIALSDALVVVASHLLTRLFESRQLDFEQQEGTLAVDQQLWRVREKVEQERRRAGLRP